MKQKLIPLVLSLCMTGTLSFSVYADSSDNYRTLEQQVAALQQELNSLKKQLHKDNVKAAKVTVKEKRVKKSEHKTTQPPKETYLSVPTSESTAYMPIDLDVPGQSFVSSGPYLGVPLEYSGSNLIINTPSVNEDVRLLSMRENINQRLNTLGTKHPEDHSHILLSGFVEGQGSYQDKGISGSSSTNISLSSAVLDVYVLGPSTWTSALMEFSYDRSNGVQEGSLNNNALTQNSRVFINKAFITIGDFLKSPFYGSIGQMYVPFGVYASTLITSPLTNLVGRTQERAFLVGYQQSGINSLYASTYIFQGDSHGSAAGRINNGGINFGYRMKQTPFKEDFGVGVIGNIADSQGMQNTGNQNSGLFGGFGATGTCTSITGAAIPCGNERLVHRVPAYNVHGKFSIGQAVDILGEYIMTSTNFNPNDLMLNSHGARPKALHTEAVYSFQALDRPTSVSAAYDMSADALALGLPAKRYSLAMNTSFWRNTLESIEFRHDVDYGKAVTSAGSQAPGPTGTGHSDNVVTAQIDLYF